MNVGARELRTRLKYYLDKMEAGQEIVIIRSSNIIGRLVPEHPAKIEKTHVVNDTQQVKFRQYQSNDMAAVKQLHREALASTGAFVENEALDRDLDNIEGYYLKGGGDFVVGELDGEIVAMGGYRLNLNPGAGSNAAELKRMRVKPSYQGEGIGGALLELLERGARGAGYDSIVLDTTDQQPIAQKLYESHGYRETGRAQEGPFAMIYYSKEL